jgi:hypothetical protein
MVMSRGQNSGRIQKIRISIISFESVEVWKIKERIKRKLKSGSACYHSLQDVFILVLTFPKI